MRIRLAHLAYLPLRAAATLLLFTTASFADDTTMIPKPVYNLKPISRAEIATAVNMGEPITARTILAEDIASVLNEAVGSQNKCQDRRALRIENSTIKGDLVIADQEVADHIETNPVPSRWLPLPITIKASSIAGQVHIVDIKFLCEFDLSDTTLSDQLIINNATFALDVVATSTNFVKGLSARYVEWRGSVIFQRANFMSNTEFVYNRFGETSFQEAIFHHYGSFLGSNFEGPMDFTMAIFQQDAQFSNTSFSSKSMRRLAPFGPFNRTEFNGQAIFRESKFERLSFGTTVFRNGVDLHHANGDILQFESVELRGRCNLDDVNLQDLEFNGFEGTMTIDGDAVFRRARLTQAWFTRIIFKNGVDFGQAKFIRKIGFIGVSFSDDVHFEDAEFPKVIQQTGSVAHEGRNVFLFDDVTLERGLYVEAPQILARSRWWAFWEEDKTLFEVLLDAGDFPREDDVVAVNRLLWRELERAFRISDNLALKNFATYRVSNLAEADLTQPLRTISIVSRWFWGYSLRPIRVIFWFTFCLFLFAGIYWTQLEYLSLTTGERCRRSKNALVFSWRTSWELKFGYEHSSTALFRAVTVAQSILAKLLVTCFVYSLTQTSPLLSELMKKLLP
jgi:uncharacterized protein YjbI with pentapeptide repeats